MQGAVKSRVHRTVAVSAPPLSAGNVTRMHRGLGPGNARLLLGKRHNHVARLSLSDGGKYHHARQFDLDARA